ncbi:small nuclear ribonucleoprotein [Bacillus swezeyi]|uniref:Small nuclear ribonucleoprotein n=1 Tax=Bacillus swezeyi TaxID=1925020 RepID=A0A1R1QZP1_9BACI|nr:small nuclear ribonucleoprotein [Bacillus swezeyi]MEC1259844.1 small nuclear ribonucleoprotein [Bacillus swezeyi]MED1740092.1 small nuclear ribonucleoprotein [Bacillus swezeyi]MED2930044.1 small nuclear ribonucleoprotein [Bacillus swezeyi]MED2944894.1 small nuclear ribonucleoprotein [Bacillus swezeyi]MED2963067.1 small nuclear ribonucleoprotein [Bacillus swezeyi]
MSLPKDVPASMPHDHQRSLHDLCRKYMHFHIVLKMKDGRSVHGILEEASREEASVLVPEDVMEERQFYYSGYGYPRRRFRRFRRRTFPFIFITALYPFPYY